MLTVRKLFISSRSHLTGTCAAHKHQSENYVTFPKIAKSLESKLGLPERPKKPMPPFFSFGVKASKELKAANSLKPIQMKEKLKVLGDMWKTVDKDEKAKMHKEFIESLASYNAAMDQYMKSLSPEDRQKLTEARRESRLLKKARIELRNSNKPTAPGNPFIVFMREKYSQKGYHELHTKEIGDAWHSLGPEEKAKYEEKYQNARKEYQKAMCDWEAQMIREGKQYLVRTSSIPNLKPMSKPSGPKKTESSPTRQPSAE